MKIIGVVGARPNFMKIDPLFRVLDREPERFLTQLVHTGQHYDNRMSKIFFEDLGLRSPDIYLGIGSGTHAEQTGKIMMRLEEVLMKEKPDLVIVVGDVNSTLAGAVTAAKLHIPIAHVEAGLRSFDRRMPEEINRVVTDALSDYLFTPSLDANENLRREGIPNKKIYFVGNVMIDSLKRCLKFAKKSDIFPIHPRTEKQIKIFGLQPKIKMMKNLKIIPPLGYIDFLALESSAKLVLTDSGGIQEETTVLDIPCLTLRETTECPVTVTQGTNQVVGHNKEKILSAAFAVLNKRKASLKQTPKFWDGRAAERIAAVLRNAKT
jgi:UDP-N-acetylglucosamine 2-epimerase (non-hydrolysing)